MTDDTELDHDGPRYVYQQFADAIANRVDTGYYKVKLPAERALPRNLASPTSRCGTR
jgi:DNA-binding GntR family transcriptional regulator